MRGAAALAVLLAASPALAAFEDLGHGARAPGMAGAFSAVADDGYAAFYNPAGLAQLRRPQFGTSYSRLHVGLSDGSDVSIADAVYALPLSRLSGTAALAWSRLALDSLYDESQFALAYARSGESPLGALHAGASLKLLRRSFARTDDARFAKDDTLAVVGPDPVLSGANSVTTPDLDLGFLLRLRGRWSLALAVQHLFEPDVAFSSSDRDPVQRAYRFGIAHKSLWQNLSAEARLDHAPSGGLHKEVGIAAERYFPTLTLGQFGLRGGFALGTEEFRQLSAGMTYRVGKLQFDYAFLIPFGGVPGTAGTHRAGLTFHFGAPTSEEEYGANLARLIREGPRVAGYAYEFEGLGDKKMTVLENVTLSTAGALIHAGRYQDALTEVSGIMARRAVRVEVVALARRLEAVTESYPSLAVSSNPWAAAVGRSIADFLSGSDRAAMLRACQAWSQFKDAGLEAWIKRMEAVSEVRAQWVPGESKLTLLDVKLRDSETMFLSGRFPEARALLEEALVIEPGHPAASARLGSVLYADGSFEEAVRVWERALPAQVSATERQNIEYMIRQARKKAGPAKAAPPRKAAPPAAPPDPELLRRMYQHAIELYSAGETGRAAELLRRILELAPEDKPAQKALKRLEREMLLRSGG